MNPIHTPVKGRAHRAGGVRWLSAEVAILAAVDAVKLDTGVRRVYLQTASGKHHRIAVPGAGGVSDAS